MSSRNVLSLLVSLVGVSTAVVVRADVKAGDEFPSLAGNGLVSLSSAPAEFAPGQVRLVDFWASWCAPCKASFPAMARLHADFSARGLQIVAVGIDEKPSAAAAFWKKMAPPFFGLHDTGQKLVRQVGVPTMPTSYLIDRAGKIRFVHEGFHGDATERELRREIETLLSEKS
jgi:thiol-disulfide isomerase/thioredoxin